jgi:hypothetical protein
METAPKNVYDRQNEGRERYESDKAEEERDEDEMISPRD